MAMSPTEAEGATGEDGMTWSDNSTLQELNTIHAQHVTAVSAQAANAACYADTAAKQASMLAQWVNYLWSEVSNLQMKVKDLEDWKRKALEDMNKLRTEHKALKRRVMPDDGTEEPPNVPKAKSLPAISAEDSSSATTPVAVERKPQKALTVAMGPPPGLGLDAATPLDEMPCEGVTVEPSTIDGKECQKVDWRIGHLSSKLKNNMGRALVSSPFKAWTLEDVRLMVMPEKDAQKGARSKKQKEQYTKKVTEGPLDACLKIKVPECPPPHIVQYYLKVGNVRKGPFEHNFQDSAVHGCSDFGINWLDQVETDQSLLVSVEIVKM